MATGNISGAAGSNMAGEAITQAVRERYWEEATPEDKIERLRDEVARLCIMVSQQAEILLKLGTHNHAPDGKLMVLMTDQLGNAARGLSLFAHDNGIPHRLRKPHERR